MSNRMTDTTSVYMYESDASQSIEYKLNQRLNILDIKHLNAEKELFNRIQLEHGFVEDENKKLKREIDILKGYIKLPWYKKLFNKFDNYERDL